MIFLNAALALGSLAFTVPLAIHLLFRNRFEIVDWGAMRFLESVVRVNRRRMQLRNLLLLLVRCAIPILLAFCLARPVLTGWQTLPGDEPVSMVLAIDTSDSLAAKMDPNTTRFTQLISTAEQIVSSLPRGSDVFIVTSADASRQEDDVTKAMPSQGDPQSTLTAFRSLRMGGGPLDIESMLSESLRKASAGATERRQIILLTDDAASDLSQLQIDALESIGERRAAQKPAPVISWVDGWKANNEASNNRRITRLEPSQSASVPGQSMVWEVEARIDGEVPTTSSIDIRVNGQTLESKTLAFRSGLARATFETTFENAGRHAIEVAMPSDDDFAADDRLRADFVTLPPIDVWLVDGNPSDKPLISDCDYLAIALSPFSLSGSKAVDLFRTSRVQATKLPDQQGDAPKIVVLADVGGLPPESAKWLADFVENQGGTLVMFAGPATTAATWDQQLVTSESKPMLPMQWGEVKTAPDANSGGKIDESRMTYPPLAAFAREAKGTLNMVDMMSYREMVAVSDETSGAKANTNVVMRLENGAPLIAVADVGKGRIMQVATTANDRWTSLPRRLAFVPLIQRLFMHLAIGESKMKAVSSGEPILMTQSQLITDQENPSQQWNVTTPLGETIPITMNDGRLRFDRTQAAGIYRFESDDKVIAYAAVNVPESELKRAAAEPSVRDEAAKRMGATRYDSLAAFQTDETTRRFGRGVWRYLLLGLLAMMIVEPFLQQRSARATS